MKRLCEQIVNYRNELLLKEPYDQYSDEISYLTDKQPQPIFPMKLFDSEKSIDEMIYELDEKISSNEILYHWMYSEQAENVCFVRFAIENIDFGCEHFSHRVLFKCKCGKEFSCKYCHEDCQDFGIVDVLCAECGQPIGCKTECCGNLLYKYICRKCGIASLSDGYSHCDVCGCVHELKTNHCSKCDRCFLSDSHVCQVIEDKVCPICYAEYDNLLLKPIILSCKHIMHKACFDRMANNERIECPLDRKDVGMLISEGTAFEKFISEYSMREVDQVLVNSFVNVQCSKCEKEMVFQKHPLGYICTYCLDFHCKEISKYEGSLEEAEESITAQYELFEKLHNREPIYPLILFPKDGNEMAPVVDCYVNKYRSFCEEYHQKLRTDHPEKIPLREVLLAYTLTRTYDESLGFAALNIMHSRQQFPENVRDLDGISSRTMVEVREMRKILQSE